MLTDVDTAYLFMEPSKERTMKGNGISVEDGDSSTTPALWRSGFFTAFVGSAQRALACLDTEVANLFDNAFNEYNDFSTSTMDSSMFSYLPLELQQKHQAMFLDVYHTLWNSYSELYLKVKNLDTSYSQGKNGGFTLFLNSTSKYLTGEVDRKSEINFIQSLIPGLLDPSTLENEGEAEGKTIEWLNETIKDMQRDEFLLLGACVYIQERILSEYHGKTPNSALYRILSSIVKDETSIRKESSLAYLKERAEKGRIELSLPVFAATGRQESFQTFQLNCEQYLIKFQPLVHEEKRALIMKSGCQSVSDIEPEPGMIENDDVTDNEDYRLSS